MRALVPIASPPFERFEAIVEAKRGERRTRLEAIRLQMLAAFENYTLNTDTLETLIALTVAVQVAEDLRHCYTGTTRPLNELRAEIIHQQTPILQAQCQYCGINPSLKSMDHYLPIETFAEFSAHALNLIPCCLECNLLKGTAWLENGRRTVINFYYDQIPQTQFLFAQINYNGNTPEANYTLSQNPNDYDGQMALMSSHFEKLELLGRFKQAAITVLSEQRDLFRSLSNNLDRAEIINQIKQEAINASARYSPNHWKVALYQAMAQSAEFINDCIMCNN